MGKHGAFIIAAYAMTGLSIIGLIVYVVSDYRRLLQALSKFPPRDGDTSE